MTQHRNPCIANKRDRLVVLIVALVLSAAAGGAFAQGASVALQTDVPGSAPAPARTVKVVCCRVSLQFLVDGLPVSNSSLMVFDTKDRSVVVDTPAPGWNFHFSLTPSNDKQTLRWASSVDVAGRVVHTWAVTGALKDQQTFTATDDTTHKTFSAVARAMVLIAPVPRRRAAPPAPVPSADSSAADDSQQ